MNRPHIPVRDGLRLPTWRPVRATPTVGQVEYVNGWRWGLVCGLVAGAMLVGVAWGLAR